MKWKALQEPPQICTCVIPVWSSCWRISHETLALSVTHKKMGSLLPPTATCAPVSHMFDCCFSLLCKLGVHGCDQSVAFEVFLRSTYLMQIEKCIHTVWVSFSFSQSLSLCFSHSLSLLLLSLPNSTVFYVTKFICGAEGASFPSSSKPPAHFNILAILSSKKCLLSLCRHSVSPI